MCKGQKKTSRQKNLLWCEDKNMSALENPWGIEIVCKRICGHDFRGPFSLTSRSQKSSQITFPRTRSFSALSGVDATTRAAECVLTEPSAYLGSSSWSEDVIWWWIESVTQQGAPTPVSLSGSGTQNVYLPKHFPGCSLKLRNVYFLFSSFC